MTREARLPADFSISLGVTWMNADEKFRRNMAQIRWELMLATIREEPARVGTPEYCAISTDGASVMLFPLPQSAGELRIRYHPHAKEA